MKRYLSIFMLLSRSVVYKMLAILFGTAALHTAVFFLLQGQQNIEAIYDHWAVQAVFGAGLVLTTALLISTLSQSGSKLDYTIRRLRVERWGLFLCQAGFNAVCFLMFWAAEIFVALLLCRLWVSSREGLSHQTVYLAFYRSELLHSLLPLDDVSRWVRNFVVFIGLGICSACAPVIQRRGKQHLGVLALPVILAFVFPGGIAEGGNDALLGFFALLAPFAMTIVTWGEEFQNED